MGGRAPLVTSVCPGVLTTVTGAGVSELGRVGGEGEWSVTGASLVNFNSSTPACTCAMVPVVVVVIDVE